MTLKDSMGYPIFRMTITEQTSSRVDFDVVAITSWEDDQGKEPIDFEPYLKGCIKWDACSHVWFGDKDGYLHLCGLNEWKKHIAVMEWIYKTISEKMGKDFDKSERWV